MEFEKQFADWQGSSYAISVATGTAALHVASARWASARATKSSCPSYTFIATSFSVVQAGAIPRFADVNLDDHCISVESAEKLVNRSEPRPSCLSTCTAMSATWTQIMAFAQRHKLFVDRRQRRGLRRQL